MRAPHAFTLHKTYTGPGCAMCGQFYDAQAHDGFDYWLVDGERIMQHEEDNDESHLKSQ